MSRDFMEKILTPSGRAILGFIQLAAYLIGLAFIIVHFVVAHGDAQAAQATAQSTAQTSSRTVLVNNNEIKALSHKIDRAIDAINDLRQDSNIMMDRMNIPITQRATTRHAIPASTQEE